MLLKICAFPLTLRLGGWRVKQNEILAVHNLLSAEGESSVGDG